MRILRARPQRQLAVAFVQRERGVLLHGHVGVAFVEEDILEHVVGRGERLFHVAELEGLVAVDVARVGVVVDARLRLRQSLFRRRDGGQRLVLHFDQTQRLGGRLFVLRHDCRHRIADVAHALGGQRMLVLRHRHDAEGHGEILARQHQVHARMRPGAFDVDRLDQRVRMRRAQQLHVQHARQLQVVGVAQLPGHLGAPVDAAARMADDIEFLRGAHALALRSLMARAACSTDSTIC